MNKKSSFIRRRGMWSFLAVGVLIITILSGVGVFLARKNNVLAAPDNPADVPGLFHSNPASTISTCLGQSECFAFTINTRLDASGGLTGTTPNVFSIPTSNPSPFNWTIDWGDGGATQTVSGTGASNSAGIPHTYSAPGEYRITILPNGTAANGWFKAFGFWTNTNGANANPNKYKFRSINTPFTTMMRRNSSLPDSWDSSFINIFYGATNGLGIPTGLFDSLNTTNGTSFSYMFRFTFMFYAYNSTTGTIPAGLFDSIDTTNGTSFGSMFGSTFSNYAYNSTTGTIPAGLFDSIDTTNGTSFGSMFRFTFSNYAYNSTTGTIPAGLFDSLNTTNGTNFGSMFNSTFSNYALNSATGTIPAGLFDSIDTTNGTDFGSMFDSTFSNYARRTATFGHSGATLEDQLFINVYSVKIGPSGAPTDNPVITAGAKIYPTYSASARNITAPVGSYTWYRTDGTSCSVTTPTPDCGEQTASTLATFPNDTEWTPETSTEKGNVTFYPQRIITDINISTITVEDSIYSGDDVATFTPTTSLTETGFTYILVPYEGNSYDNDSFIISGSTLRLNTTLNHLAKPNYTIYVQVTDSDGNTFHKQFTLNVSHVEIPPETLPPSPGTPSAPDIPISLPDITAPNTGYLQIGNQVYDKTSVMIVLAVTAIVGAGYTVSVISRRQKATANVRAAKQRRQ